VSFSCTGNFVTSTVKSLYLYVWWCVVACADSCVQKSCDVYILISYHLRSQGSRWQTAVQTSVLIKTYSLSIMFISLTECISVVSQRCVWERSERKYACSCFSILIFWNCFESVDFNCILFVVVVVCSCYLCYVICYIIEVQRTIFESCYFCIQWAALCCNDKEHQSQKTGDAVLIIMHQIVISSYRFPVHLYLRCYGCYPNPRLVFPSTTVIFPSPVNHEKVIVQYPVRKELQQLDIVMNCWRAVTLVCPIQQSALLCGEDSHALLDLKVFGFPLHGNWLERVHTVVTKEATSRRSGDRYKRSGYRSVA
jgi:hypothetical protein